MNTTTKRMLVDRIAAKTHAKRGEVRRIVQLLLDEIAEDLVNGGRIEFRDFGVLECRERKARVAQNPKTLRKVLVPPRKIVKFKAGRSLRKRLDESCASLVEAAQNMNHH